MDEMMSAPDSACIFRQIDGRVKEFVLTEVSRRAIQDLFDTAEATSSEAILNNDLAFLSRPSLIDSSIGTQPFNYALVRLRAMMDKFPDTRKGLVAIILPSSPLLNTLSAMMRPLAPMRIYTPQQRNQALAWLLASTNNRGDALSRF
jgi:hypothetical protein